MSIRWKLGIIFLVISLVPFGIFSIITVDKSREMLKREIGQNFQLLAHEKAMEIVSTLDRRVEEAKALARNPMVIQAVAAANALYEGKDNDTAIQEILRIDRVWLQSKGDTPEARKIIGNDISGFLKDYQGRDPLEYGEIFFTDRFGATVAMTSTLTDYYQADEGWWREGFGGGKGAVFIDDRGMDISVRAVVTGVVVPIQDGGKVVGILKINFKMAHIPAIVQSPYAEGDVTVFLMRSNGIAVVDPSGGVHQIANDTEARIMAVEESVGWTEDYHDHEPTIMGHSIVRPKNPIYSRKPLDKNLKGIVGENWGRTDWHVFVERNMVSAYAPVSSLMTTFILSGIGFAVLVVLIAGVAATTVTNPLLILRERMERISIGNLDIKLGGNRKDEIGDFMHAIDRMVTRLKETLASRDELNQQIHQREKVEKALRERSIELELSKKEAERANQAKSRFLSSTTHDLRTPLNSIIGFSQLMQNNPKEPLSPAQKDYTDNIVASGEILLELINDLLDLAAIEAGRLHLSMEDVYAKKIIDESISLMLPSAAGQDITITNRTIDQPPFLIHSDVLRLKQVLLNLLSNAVKYNKPGGTVTLGGNETGDGYLRISVSDTGIGIPLEHHPDIFKPFERLGIEAKKTIEGTGIGLTVAKQLVERMGGRIGFESAENKGSTFWVEIPLASKHEEMHWDIKFRVGIKQIDDDHKVLIGLLNKLSDRNLEHGEVERLIGELIDYTLYHFKREETVMAVCNYPQLDDHRKIHKNLATKAGQFAEKWRQEGSAGIIQELLDFLRVWLVDHIMHEDANIEPFAKGKEAEINQALERVSNTK